MFSEERVRYDTNASGLLEMEPEEARKGKSGVPEYASVLGTNSDYRTAAAHQKQMQAELLQQVLPNTASQQIILEQVEQYLRKGNLARKAGHYERTLNKLQKGKSLLQQLGQESANFGLHLGRVLSHFGKWSEAEAELQRALFLQTNSDPTSKLTLLLRNALSESYLQKARWGDVVTLCEETLQILGQSTYNFKLLQIVFYLVLSYFQLNDWDLGVAVATKWINHLHIDSNISWWVQDYVKVLKFQGENNTEWAFKCGKGAVERGQKVMPNSLLTAISTYNLSKNYVTNNELEIAKLHYVSASQLLSTHFPTSTTPLSAFTPSALSAIECLENMRPKNTATEPVCGMQLTFPCSLNMLIV